jgi:hypothetical protein
MGSTPADRGLLWRTIRTIRVEYDMIPTPRPWQQGSPTPCVVVHTEYHGATPASDRVAFRNIQEKMSWAQFEALVDWLWQVRETEWQRRQEDQP